MAGYISPERKALQTKANIFVILGIVLSFVTRGASFLMDKGDGGLGPAILILLLAIAGLTCWMIGLSAFAQSKGYSKWYALLGLLSCCGLIILAIMPNKWIDTPTQGYGPGDYPRPNG